MSNEKIIFAHDKIGFVECLNSLGDDLTVVNSARVSFGKESKKLTDKDKRLIRYLYEHKHWTPFSHVIFQFRIKMPFFVARQWYRHQIGLTRNEISRRYVKEKPQFFMPDYFRINAKKIKQGSLDKVNDKNDHYIEKLNEFYKYSYNLYNEMLEVDIPAEQARIVLPLGAYTEFIETASLAAYMRVYSLRVSKDAQKETAFYIKAIFRFVEEICPISSSLVK
ncbi:MAG: FAD-dependent thymidylate synthase [Deferribacterota bacterium]|nr:FAD-dependent thymidylate synthase [Deferribacterota bacterium]